MPPKTPDELREQIEKQNEEPPAAPGKERTAEGMEVTPPSRDDFFGNLKKVSRSKGESDADVVSESTE